MNNNITFKKEMKVILKTLIDKRIMYLTENGNDDDIPNDLQLNDLEALYSKISREIYNSYYSTKTLQ
jgi:hypothetical protein